jgi:hypothetical protein
MSTLVAQTISNGTVSTSSANVIQGSAKAWVSWTGSTSVIQSAYNVSSVTRTNVGEFTIAFTNALSDTNYAAVFGGCQSAGFGNSGTVQYHSTAANHKTTTQIRVLSGYQNGTQDLPQNALAIFR